MEDLFRDQVLFPDSAAAAAGGGDRGFLLHRRAESLAHWPIWLGVGVSAVLSISLLVGMVRSYRQRASTVPSDYVQN